MAGIEKDILIDEGSAIHHAMLMVATIIMIIVIWYVMRSANDREAIINIVSTNVSNIQHSISKTILNIF